MSEDARGEAGERLLGEAADWFAKMRGPEASRWASQFTAWREQSPEHQAAYARMLRRWDQSAFLTNTQVGRARDLQSVATWRRRPNVRYTSIAASILVVTTFATLALRSRAVPDSPQAFVALAAPTRAVRAVAFNGGARAILDAGAAIESRSENGARRFHLVRGRVRFDVAHAPQPVIVEADGRQITCTACVFDISLSPPTMTVALWRGEANVRGAPDADAWTGQITRGRQLVFVSARSAPSEVRADPGQLGWTRGMLSFERTRLGDAVAALNRYNVRQVRLSPSVAGLRVTGAFHANDPEGFAHAVATMFQLTLARRADGSIELSPGAKA